MEIYLDPEEKIQCPYESSHFIMRKRMNFHITRCKKNFPEAPLVECDFNVNHKIPEPEMQYHSDHCPDRKKIEFACYQDTKTDLNKFPIANIHVECEENWDSENVSTYDPVKYCENNEIIRRMDVASAARKRNFRLEERARISKKQEEKNKLMEQQAEASTSKVKIESRANLPETKSGGNSEETPLEIEAILQKIKIGANQVYHQKN